MNYVKVNEYDLLIFVYEEFIGNDSFDSEQLFFDSIQAAGFDDNQANFYIKWFKDTFSVCDEVRNLAPTTVACYANAAVTCSSRYYNEEERQYLGNDGVLLLEVLLSAECISLDQREFIIERVLAVKASECIDLEQLKWLILMIISNQKKELELDVWKHEFIVNWESNYLTWLN